MTMTRQQQLRRRFSGIGVTLTLIFATTSVAQAETRTFDCSFVSRYSSGEVLAALSFARRAVGVAEAGSLYNSYASLKNECQANPKATRVVNIPADVAAASGI